MCLLTGPGTNPKVRDQQIWLSSLPYNSNENCTGVSPVRSFLFAYSWLSWLTFSIYLEWVRPVKSWDQLENNTQCKLFVSKSLMYSWGLFLLEMAELGTCCSLVKKASWAPGNWTFQWTPNVKRLARNYGGSDTEQANRTSLCWAKLAECESGLFAWEISHVPCLYIKILNPFYSVLSWELHLALRVIHVTTLHVGSGHILVVNIRSAHGVWWLPVSSKESWIISP